VAGSPDDRVPFVLSKGLLRGANSLKKQIIAYIQNPLLDVMEDEDD
jgi:hypothetical protein